MEELTWTNGRRFQRSSRVTRRVSNKMNRLRTRSRLTIVELTERRKSFKRSQKRSNPLRMKACIFLLTKCWSIAVWTNLGRICRVKSIKLEGLIVHLPTCPKLTQLMFVNLERVRFSLVQSDLANETFVLMKKWARFMKSCHKLIMYG